MRFVGIIPQYTSQMNSKSSSAVISSSNSSRELRGDKTPSDFPEDCALLDHEKEYTNGGKIPTAASEENVDQCINPSEDPRGQGQVTEHLSLSSAEEKGGQLQGEKTNGSPRLQHISYYSAALGPDCYATCCLKCTAVTSNKNELLSYLLFVLLV